MTVQNSQSQHVLEARFSTLISNLQEAILVEDENREIIYANQRFCNMFGFPMAPSEMVGMDCSNAAEESKGYFKDPEGFVQRVETLLKHKEIVIGDELELVNGIFLERDYVPVWIDKDYRGHMWKYRDITAHKNMILELSRANEKVEAKNKELEKFAYIVSHDLKSPLRRINALSNWMKESIDNNEIEKVKDELDMVLSVVHDMDALINGILEYSRSGLENSPLEICDINQIVQSIIEPFGNNKNIHFSIPPELPQFDCHKTPLTQIFSNLVNNAINHNDKEEIYIEIGFNDLGQNYEFRIKDNGPGIDKKYHEKVFDIFQTLTPSDSNNNTGVGLAIVKKVIESMGGVISIQSSDGKGTTFIFKIPKHTDQSH